MVSILLTAVALSLLHPASSPGAVALDEAPASSAHQLAARGVAAEEVAFFDGPTLLAGTLMLPAGGAPCPGIVLLGGAERGPRGPYKDRMARHFVAHGIAALTYDSPGTGRSVGTSLFQTKADRVREALAAHRFLRGREPLIDDRVGIWGISEGAGIALLAAASAPEVAFVIPVSGALGVAPLDVIRYRIEMMGLERGLGPEAVQKARGMGELLFGLLAGLEIIEWPRMHLMTAQWPGEPWEELIDAVRRCRSGSVETQERALQERLRQVIGRFADAPWFEVAVIDRRRTQQFLSMDPRLFFDYLEKGPFAAGDWNHDCREHLAFPMIRCPVLAVWGEMDDFVPSHRSAAGFEACMAATTNDDVTIEIISGASHLITVPGSRTDFAGDYPEILTRWLDKHQELSARRP